jgi:hypothetical protein
MSLIALIYGQGNSWPVLIGDLLISSSKKQGDISLPTFFAGIDTLVEGERDFYEVSIQQKIYIISDNLAIALAGSVYEMKTFLNEIKNNFKYLEISWNNVVLFIKEYQWIGNFDSSSLILLFHDGKIFNVYSYKCTEHYSPSFGKMIISGSGSETFKNTVSNHTIANEFEKTPSTDIIRKIVARNIILMTKFLVIEKTSLETLLEHWGAGFEMISWEKDRLRKAENVTYVIILMHVNVDSRQITQIPLLIYNYRYHEDLLVLTVNDCQLKEVKQFSVPSIVDEDVPIKLVPRSVLDLKASNYSLTMSVVYSNGEHQNITVLVGEDQINLEVSKSDLGKQNISFSINEDLMQFFQESALKEI